MKTFLRRFLAASILLAMLAVPVALATPSISFTPGAFPATGSPVAVASTPSGLTISVTATPTAGSSIVSVSVSVNGTPIGSATGASPFLVNWVPTSAGTFTIAATVTDTSAITTGASASTNTATINSIVTVNAARAVTVTAPANNSAVTQGSELFLRSSATMTDGLVTSVDFFLNGALVGSVSSAPYNLATTISIAPGTYPYFARANSSGGATFDSATLNLNVVSALGTGPTVTLTSPSAADVIAVGVPVTLTATASDSDGFIPSSAPGGVTFYADGDPIGTDFTAPYSIAWTPTVARSVSLRALVTDDKSNTRLSFPVGVTVLTSAPSVSITAPANNSSGTVGVPITVNANATASLAATVSSVQLYVDGLPVGAPDTAAPYSFIWTPSAAMVSVLTVRVTDSNSLTVASAPVNVTVAPAASALAVSLTAPTNGTVIPLGTSTTLSATATAAGTATVNRVDFLSGSTIVGTVLTPPYNFSWTPTTAGIVALTARVTDSNGATANSSAVNVNITASTPTVAMTAPANGATLAQNTPTTLSANASASPGQTVTRVDFLSGTNVVGTALTPPYSVSWTPTVAGVAALTARVTDSAGSVATSTAVNVNVSAVGSTLSVAITAPTNGTAVPLGTSTTISAFASAAGLATVNRVDFRTTIGTTTTTIGTVLTPPYNFSWTPTAAGIVGLTAIVTDSNGATATSPVVNVSVTGPTITLVSDVTPGTTGTIGTPVRLTATPTTAAGTTVAKVDFFQGTTLLLPSVTAAPYTYDWTPTASGTFPFTARVTDSNGAVATSTSTSVTVAASAPTISISAPPSGSTVALNVPTTFSASAVAGAGQTVTRVDFFANGGAVGTSLNSPYSVQWTPTSSGVTTLTARVTDSSGDQTISAGVLVTATGTTGGLNTTLTLTGSSAIPAGSSRAVTVTATGGTGVYDRLELYYDATLVGTDTVPPYNFLFTAPNELGTHYLTARVVDTTGLSATSAAVPITLTQPVGGAPAVAIVTPASGSFLGAGTQTAITGTASDPDSVVSVVQVFVNGTSIGNATISGSNWAINWTPTVVGVASISAIATDTNGNSVVAPAVGVTVTDSSSPGITLSLSPGTIAGGIATLPSGATRNVVANVSPATGRAIVRVEFFVDGTKVGEDTSIPYTFRYVAPGLAAGEQSHAYVLSARATDNAGAARDTLQSILVIAPIGQPPVVSLLTPANGAAVAPNTSISLASTAVATGGTIVSVQYYVNGSPAPVNGGNPITSAPYTSSFVPTVPGAYVIDAIATDDRGNSRVSNAATITASFAVPTVAITTPNPNATARATPNVPLNIVATATVQTGTGAAILLVEFLLDGVQIGADTTAPYTYSWTPTTAQLGAHVLTARVTDTNSQTATSNPVNVNVANSVGTPPTITISTNPIPGQGLQTLSQVNFIANAAASATGVTIASVEFFLNDVSIGTASREQATNLYRIVYDFSRFDVSTAPAVTDPNTGVTRYTPIPVYAIARDSNNNQTVSTTTNLTLNPSTSSAPSLQLAALSPTTIAQGQQFFIGATFNDTDGTVTQMQLYANGILSSTVGNPQQGQLLTYNANTAGRFNLYAVALDDTGNSVVSSPSIVVNVNALNPPTTTITQPANDATITTVGAPVFLEGTAVATGTNQVPTLQFVITGSAGGRTTLNGVRIGTTTVYRQIWTPTTPDTYSIATVANLGGTTSSTSTISRRAVVNNLIGLAPTITISVPGTATTASRVNFTATAADSDGSVIDVEFFVNRESIGQAVRDQLANTWRLTASFAGVTPGATEVVARARDSSGNVVASTTSNINVTAASSNAPTISVSPSTTSAAFSRQVQLTANARDSDGTISSVQYFANSTSLGSSGNAGTSYLVNWTPTTAGTFSLYGIATDNTGNVVVSPTVLVTVQRNDPLLESAAFILQTYQDIPNTTTINPLVFADLEARLDAGTLTRAELVASLTGENGFTQAVNFLAAYYVVMGQWPTPANYNSLIGSARNNLSNAIGSILASNEYFAKYGIVPTVALLNSPTGLLPALTYLTQLHRNAGKAPPSPTEDVQFRNNNVLSATLGRGYNVGGVGLNTALAEFVVNTNSGNTALFALARSAALYYQIDRPPPTVTVAEISSRVAELVSLPGDVAKADAVLKDTLYAYRFVTITKHPESLVVAPRSGALFSVEAVGSPPLAYQWLLNGAPIAGATNSLLSLTNVDARQVGTYTVSVTSSVASATSIPATLTLATGTTRLVNISTRGVTTGGANVLIAGFVVSGNNLNQTRQMLIRVVGPTLGAPPFSVGGFLPNPRLEVYAANLPNPVLVNDDWGQQTGGAQQVTAIRQATTRAGAFALSNGSEDSAVLATLPPGLYTAQALVAGGSAAPSGVVLIEVYDVTQGGAAAAKASNVSTRGAVGTGTNIVIAGFVVDGTASRRMLIRGAGPSLTRLGVPGVLADPQLRLIDQSSGRVLRTNDDWATGADAAIIAAASNAAGAFPLINGGKDAAMILMLPPGAYTVQLSGVNNGTGVGIVEVYDVDP